MGADFSRIRFDPLRDFAGIALQQGRVMLDADFNEYVAILDRRLRAETSDLTSFGPDPNHAGVAWVPRLTPNAFRITAAAGDLTIGRGRMYVDGLLAENHGGGDLEFDRLLSEETGSTDLVYDDQPYLPTPDDLPSGGPHLVYLDVWNREVTHLEAEDLVEVAVGVDSATRTQTVWQVRVLANAGAGACAADDDDIPGWVDIIRPSGGRLTTDTIEVDPADDPCELPPTGGYRGLENQLYRVEIHEGGAPGTATFKWSRDNGTVAMPVVEIVSTTELRLATVGKDDVLRVSTGDWVEILDDHREFNQVPGVMRQVTVDDADRTISFQGALPADLQPANATDANARHMRVRKWDQAGVIKSGAGATLTDLTPASATGLITVPSGSTTEVVLESGIVVSFSVDQAGSVFRNGDYWVFAARTADASVEELDEAPPRGIHHHYARLASVTFPASQTDCRTLWPPLSAGGEDCGDCTVCVTAASHATGALTVQGAVDMIKDTGGTVCLATGVYDVGAGITIDGGQSVRIRGQGLTTVVSARGVAFTAQTSYGITLENLAIISGTDAPAAIRLRNVAAATVQDTAVLSYGSEKAGSAAVELSGAALSVGIRRNVLIGFRGVDGAGEGEGGVFAAALRMEDNIIGAFGAVDLGGLSAFLLSCRVTDNDIVSGRLGGITATGVTLPGGSLELSGNKIATTGPGITAGADAEVSGNAINGLGEENGTDGIVIASPGFAVEPGHLQILANRIHDRTGTAISLTTAVRTFMVKQNVISGASSGIAVSAQGAAERIAVDNNEIFDIERTQEKNSVFGIAITNARSAAVVGNVVSQVGTQLVEGDARVGIAVLGCEQVRLNGNVVDEVAPPEAFVGLALGIAAIGPFASASATDNTVRFSRETDGPAEGRWTAMLVASSSEWPARMGDGRTVVPLRGRSLVLTEGFAYLMSELGDHVTVSGNVATGGGAQPSYLVAVGGDVIAEANQCAHAESGEPVAMLLRADTMAVGQNRIRGGKGMLILETSEERFSAVGNLTAGGTHLGGPGNGLPAPWDSLNPTVT